MVWSCMFLGGCGGPDGSTRETIPSPAHIHIMKKHLTLAVLFSITASCATYDYMDPSTAAETCRKLYEEAQRENAMGIPDDHRPSIPPECATLPR